MAKLKPDYIEWVLTLNASDAQKEIHNLSEKNKELRDSNKEIKKAMTDLIATGKAGGKQWKRLDEQLKENNKTIGENNKKIAECEKRQLRSVSPLPLGYSAPLQSRTCRVPQLPEESSFLSIL